MKDYKPFSQDCDYDIRALRRETIEQMRNDEAAEKARHKYALQRSLYGDYDYPNTWDDEPTEWADWEWEMHREEAEQERLERLADFLNSPKRPVASPGGHQCPFIRNERTRPNF